MKQLTGGVLGVLLALSVSGNGFLITGHITKVPDGTMLYLSVVENGLKNVDSTWIHNARFSFKGGPVDQPKIWYIRAKGKFLSLAEFYLDNDTIMIEGELYGEMKITGNPLNEALSEYNRTVLFNITETSKADQALKMHPASDTQLSAILRKRFDSLKNSIEISGLEFIKKYRHSIVALDALVNISSSLDANGIEQALKLLDPSLSGRPAFSSLMRKVQNLRKTTIGNSAPFFTLPGEDSIDVSLKALRGKYVLIDFWASWCVPCRGENPNLIKAYQKFRHRNLEIVGISVDKSRKAWLDAVHKDSLSWINVIDMKGECAHAYGLETVPYNVLIDPYGKIIACNLRGKSLEDQLDKLLIGRDAHLKYRL